MGGDGGSLPTRGDLVKEKQKEELPNPAEQTRYRWTHCRLSSQSLGADVATCKYGFLYNREAALQYIADVRSGKRSAEAAFAHLRIVKDLLPLHATLIEGASDDSFPRWKCPITFLEANGQHAFCAMRPCGCVLSLRAVKEVPSSHCLVCGKKLDENNSIIHILKPDVIASLAPPSASSALIIVDEQRKEPHHLLPVLYKSPLEKLREERAKQREEAEVVEEKKRQKQLEETRLLATKRVGALLPPPPSIPSSSSSSSTSSSHSVTPLETLSGKRRDISSVLSQPHPSSNAKRVAAAPRDRSTSKQAIVAVGSGHLASLFSASLKHHKQ